MDFKEKYFEIWKTAWDFHKKWCNHNNTDSEWKKIIDEREQGNTYKIAFVTNDFHLYRSRRLAKYVGFTAIGLCAPTPRDILLPNLIREVCSVIVSCIRFRT